MLNYLFIFGAEYLIFFVITIAVIYFLKQPRKIQNQIIIFGIIVLPAAYLVAKISGLIYYDPRPFVQGNFIPLISHVADNGFPSDHTLLSSAISLILYPFNKKISAILWLLTILVGISRVYVGVHHPIDILASIVIAIIVAFLIQQLIKKLKWGEEKNSNLHS